MMSILLVFASQTPDYRTPCDRNRTPWSSWLARRVAAAFDINQACTSSLHAWAVAHSMLVAGTAQRALVINADAITQLIHPMDRGLVPLHGDAAAVCIMEAVDSDPGTGFEFFEFGTAGAQFDRLLVPAGGAKGACGPSHRHRSHGRGWMCANQESPVHGRPSDLSFQYVQGHGLLERAAQAAWS